MQACAVQQGLGQYLGRIEVHCQHRALALQEQGEDILLLSVGDPDFDTPLPTVKC